MGSEMCIRDRHLAGRLGESKDRHGGLRLARTRFTDESDDLVTICLLYTSDAADDLLCVDLGGRRIIKKKN